MAWFRGREEVAIFLAGWPLSGAWRWRCMRTQASGRPALGFYAWDGGEGAHLPFALNVLTIQGSRISDVTALVTRAIGQPEREVYARWPERPADAPRLLAAFGRFGLPERLPPDRPVTPARR